jgi:hypothetical protein
MTGQIDILNTGHGHIEVKFNEKDAIETERAKRVITDMLRRGYALFVTGPDGSAVRVESFDATKGVYIVADVPTESQPVEPTPLPEPVTDGPKNPLPQRTPQGPIEPPQVKRGRPKKEVPMHSAKVTAVGRSAGG